MIILTVGIVGVLVTTVSSQAQGYIVLDNYDVTPGNLITYGGGAGGTLGTGIIGPQWTIGMYYAAGTVPVVLDPAGFADPLTLGPLTLATGPGATSSLWPGLPGYFAATNSFSPPGSAGGETYTFVVVAFNGSTYDTSMIRGHSAGFTEALSPGIPNGMAQAMPAFSVIGPVPEPTTIALGGLGVSILLLARRVIAQRIVVQ